MNVSLKGRYTNGKSIAAGTLAVNASDVKLRASRTDVKIVKGPSLNGLTLAVEKPGRKKGIRSQFTNVVRFVKKRLKLTYSRNKGDRRTVVNGALVFDSANKVSATYVLGSKNCKLKYSYVLGGVTTFEPCYELGKNAWDFAISRRVYDNVFKATYQAWIKNLALEWSKDSKFNGTFKVSATINLAEESENPKFIAESNWELEV